MSPKLPRGVSGDEVVRVLRRLGWQVVHARGSHRKLRYLKVGRQVIVPLHRELKPGTLRRILRDAGIEPDEFRRLLGRKRGAASVEHVALAAAIALIAIAAIAAVRSAGPDRGARELGEMIGRRIACAPRYPVPCGRHPLALAYGFPVGKLVRHLAPSLEELGAASASGTLLPVDFRRCRRASCALAGPEPGLTASNRRVTLFTAVSDGRRAGGPIRVSYWLYRPTLGWELIERTASAGDLAAAQAIRLNREALPDLVPLETLAGRDHYRFFGRERPPWRGRVADRVP